MLLYWITAVLGFILDFMETLHRQAHQHGSVSDKKKNKIG